MDNQSIYIGIIITAICILPLIILWWKRQKRDNLIKDEIIKQAQKEDCKLNKISVNSAMAIGVDEAKMKVFFYKKEKDKAIHLKADLSNISNCRAIKSQDITDGENTVDHLDLAFNYKDKSKESLIFNFFGKNNILALDDEFILLTEWEEYLNSLIKNK